MNHEERRIVATNSNLVQTSSKNDLALQTIEDSSHPTLGKWLWIRVAGVRSLQDRTHWSHDDSRRKNLEPAHERRRAVLLGTNVLIHVASNALFNRVREGGREFEVACLCIE